MQVSNTEQVAERNKEDQESDSREDETEVEKILKWLMLDLLYLPTIATRAPSGDNKTI